MAIKINWKILSEKDRKKVVKIKTTKSKKLKFNIWTKIYFIWRPEFWRKLYEWKIIEFLENDLVKVKAIARKSKEFEIIILSKKKLNLDIK